MMCGKCKTALPSGTKPGKCPVCGADTGSGKTRTRVLIGVVLLILAAGVVYLALSFARNSAPEDEESTQTAVLPAEEDSTPEVSGEQLEEAAEPAVTGDEREEPVNKAEIKAEMKAEDAVFALLSDIAEAAQELVKTGAYITNKGYLYNSETGKYASAEGLVPDTSGIPASARIRLLYLLPREFVGEVMNSLSDGEQNIRVYAAYDSGGETLSIADAYGGKGVIYSDRINAILALYDNVHGEIAVPEAESPVYDEILALAESYTFASGGYDILWCKADERYVFAIMRDIDADARRGFIFRLDEPGGHYFVAASDVERAENLRAYVNGILPDFNPDMLPAFGFNDEINEEINEEIEE